MRRILLGLLVAVICLLVTTTATGCGEEMLATQARSSFTGFVTGVVSGALTSALSGN